MTGREILKLAAVGGVAVTLLAALGGCAAPSVPAANKESACIPCPVVAPGAQLGGQKLFDNCVIHSKNSETAVFNVAETVDYHHCAATALMNYFDEFAEKNPKFNYPMGLTTVPLTVKPRVTQYNWLLINEDRLFDRKNPTADEKWTNIRVDIGKTAIGQKAQYHGNVPVSPLSDPNYDFARSACDVSMVVTGEGVTESERVWQDIVCESLIQAYRYRLKETPYDSWNPLKLGYIQEAAKDRLSFSDTKRYGNTMRPYIFDPMTYGEIPTVPVLSRK